MEARRVVTSIARKELGYSDGKVGDAEAGTDDRKRFFEEAVEFMTQSQMAHSSDDARTAADLAAGKRGNFVLISEQYI